MGWDPKPEVGEQPITYRQFRGILITEEVTTNDRKAHELWKILLDLGIARKVNQSDTLLVRQEALVYFLARKSEYYANLIKNEVKT